MEIWFLVYAYFIYLHYSNYINYIIKYLFIEYPHIILMQLKSHYDEEKNIVDSYDKFITRNRTIKS